jgi:uncharacterized protein YecE (DUF72 family)
MTRVATDIRVGTSGFHYEHWIKRFYPQKLPKDKWLQYYTEHFNTVELNNTFYRQPKDSTFERWRKLSPKDFLYAVKANRFITHIKRLKEAEESLERFLTSACLLKKKLGPVLFQLPPGFHKDLDRLEGFLKLLPGKKQSVFEFRHKSWYSDDAFELLKKYNTAFCIHDMERMETPRVVTADFIYVRFHGIGGRYSGNYPDSILKDWTGWLKEYLGKVRSVYAYFNNDTSAYAVYNAKTLKGYF